MSPVASTRWCPTPEQLMILEELYRNGVRTPNAPQIQRIAAHLSMFGKIEGKNVFYWFQNHKARDRQKLRKKIIKQLEQQHEQQQQQQQQQVQYFPYDHHHYDHLQYHVTRPDRADNHHLLLNFFDPLSNVHLPHASCASPGFVHLSALHSSPTFPPLPPHPVGIEGAPRIMEDTNMMMRSSSSTCGHDRMMMKMAMEDDDDVGSPPSPQHCTNSSPTKSLKTLELFPITATNLKEERNSKHLY